MSEPQSYRVGDARLDGGKLRTITEGKTYIIQPSNPRKLKNRDRVCTILRFIKPSPGDLVAVVRYHDTNRQGRADIEDLRPVK